jgi:hypothetical protein
MRITLQDKALQFNDGHITTDDNFKRLMSYARKSREELDFNHLLGPRKRGTY